MKVCADVYCPELTDGTYCEEHRRPAWEGSKRRQRMGSTTGWAQQKRNKRVLRAHRRVCHWCGLDGADEVDHIVPLAEGGSDDEVNLAPIHGSASGRSCHREKTAMEAARGRARQRGEV